MEFEAAGWSGDYRTQADWVAKKEKFHSGQGVAFSLLLHLGVWALIPPPPGPTASEPIIEITLAPEPPPPPSPPMEKTIEPAPQPIAKPQIAVPAPSPAPPVLSGAAAEAVAPISEKGKPSDGGDGQGNAAAGTSQPQAASSPPPVDPMPAYLEQVRQTIQTHLVYPDDAKRLGLQGSVMVRFSIDADGSINLASAVFPDDDTPILFRKASRQTLVAIGHFQTPPQGKITVALPFTFRLTN